MSELATGETAPAFPLSDANGKQISLDDYADQQVIVYFYPKAATPGCTTEACDFRDNINSLAAAGYQVIGLSLDDPEELKAIADLAYLSHLLLSDLIATTVP